MKNWTLRTPELCYSEIKLGILGIFGKILNSKTIFEYFLKLDIHTITSKKKNYQSEDNKSEIKWKSLIGE